MEFLQFHVAVAKVFPKLYTHYIVTKLNTNTFVNLPLNSNKSQIYNPTPD